MLATDSFPRATSVRLRGLLHHARWPGSLVLAILLALPAEAQQPGPCAAPDSQRSVIEVLRQQQAFAEAMLGSDWTRLGDFMADEFVYVHSFGEVDTKQELLTFVRGFSRFSEWLNQDPQVAIYGTTAVVRSNLREHGYTLDNHEIVRQFRALDVWVAKNGQWLLVAHQSTKYE